MHFECANCKTEFVSNNPRRRFCSQKCRLRWNNANGPGEKNRRLKKLFIPGYGERRRSGNRERRERDVENCADWYICHLLRERIPPIINPTKEQIKHARQGIFAQRMAKSAKLQFAAEKIAAMDPDTLPPLPHGPPKCKVCGEDDPSAFFPRTKAKCAQCVRLALQQRYRTDYEYCLYIRAKRMCQKYGGPGYRLDEQNLKAWKERLRFKDMETRKHNENAQQHRTS